jgi:hypothetical protein
MNYSSATGSSVHQTVALIMLAKLLEVLFSQLITKTMDRMTEQMAQRLLLSKLPHGLAYMGPWLSFSMMWTMLLEVVSKSGRTISAIGLLNTMTENL